jgi:hypothetical protein
MTAAAIQEENLLSDRKYIPSLYPNPVIFGICVSVGELQPDLPRNALSATFIQYNAPSVRMNH